MNNRMTCIVIGTLASLLMIMLMAMIAAPVNAGTPSQPHNANTIWVEPGKITLDPSYIDTTFNATVSLNITENIYAYQCLLHYNHSLFKCTRAGFTDGVTSNYFVGHSTFPAGPNIDTGTYGNGTVFFGETCLSSDFIAGPNNGTLGWIEFRVLNFTSFMPTSGNLTTVLDVSSEIANSNTLVLAQDGLTPINIGGSNSTIIITPEFPYLAILPIFMALTLAGAVFSRRQKKLK